MIMELIILVVGLLVGYLLGWVSGHSRGEAEAYKAQILETPDNDPRDNESENA